MHSVLVGSFSNMLFPDEIWSDSLDFLFTDMQREILLKNAP